MKSFQDEPTAAWRDRVVVIVAITADHRSIRRSIRRFAAEVRGLGRLVLVDGSANGVGRIDADVDLIRSRPRGLVPELWSDGLHQTTEPLVAFSTASMVPTVGWLAAAIAKLKQSAAAGIFGPIEPGPTLSPLARAVYLLRYIRYHRPLSTANSFELPGENALYRRDALESLGTTFPHGFWESEVNQQLLENGQVLTTSESALLRYEEGGRAREILRRRFLHARHYGSTRAAKMTVSERVARTIAAPLIPFVLVLRIVTALASKGISIGPSLSGVLWLPPMLVAWVAGEMIGAWFGPPGFPIVNPARRPKSVLVESSFPRCP